MAGPIGGDEDSDNLGEFRQLVILAALKCAKKVVLQAQIKQQVHLTCLQSQNNPPLLVLHQYLPPVIHLHLVCNIFVE